MTIPLVLEGLGKRFGSLWAIRDLSITVPEGRIVGFLGANGAGKTTTIRILLGLIPATEGQAQILGQPVPARVAVMRLVGSLSEDPRFYPWLSGRGNLRVLLQPLGISQAEIDAAIDRVGLLEVASKKVKTYSHGMRTRLGLAQAICGDPRVLVLDEPTTGLDPVWIRELRRILRDAADSGAAVLLSSHQLTEVEESCDRAVILRDGHVAAQGSLSEIVGSSGWYVVELREEDIPGAIAAFGGIGHERLSHGIRVEADSGRLVNELLASAGIVPESVRPEGSSLEQRFFELLGEDAGRNADSRLG